MDEEKSPEIATCSPPLKISMPSIKSEAEDILSIAQHNPDWNDRIEQNAKEIGEMSQSYKMMHVDMARKTNKKYTFLIYSGIILGPLGGTLASISAIFNQGPFYIDIFVAILGYLSGLIAAILKFGRFEAISNSNKDAAGKYTSLESNVRRQLSLYRKDRAPAGAYLEWVSKSFDELYIAAPLLPQKIYRKYAKQAKCEGIAVPKEYGQNVGIDENYENQKVQEICNKGDIVINIGNVRTSPVETEPEVKGDKIIKRGDTLAQFPGLNRYGDGLMNYEMKRFMGFR